MQGRSRTDPSAGKVTRVATARAACALILTVGLAGCGGGGGGSGGGGGQPSGPPALASGVIGPAGGVVAVDDPASPHFGTRVTFPANALAAATLIEIRTAELEEDVPSFVAAFEVHPQDLPLTGPLPEVTVRIPDEYGTVVEDLLEERLSLFAISPGEPVRLVQSGPPDTTAHTLSADVDRFGKFFAAHAFLYRLLWQPSRLYDPAVPAPVQDEFGVEILVEGGSGLVMLGQGALAGPGGFFDSGSANNVLVLHGVFSSPVDFTTATDVAAGLEPDFANVVLAQYPSVRGIADSANALYDEIHAALDGAAPDFGFHVVGFSMGGLVARYLIESSHLDPNRPGFAPGDPPLDAFVASLVLLATPNQGTPFGDDILAVRFPNLPAEDLPFFQGAVDLGVDSFLTVRLNQDFSPSLSAYYALAGQLPGEEDDGVVSIQSALDEPSPISDSQLFVGPEYLHTELGFGATETQVMPQILDWIRGE